MWRIFLVILLVWDLGAEEKPDLRSLPLNDLCAAYKRLPTEAIRKEIVSRKNVTEDEFSNALYLGERTAAERGIFHNGSFEKEISEDVLRRIKDRALSVEALSARIRQFLAENLPEKPASTEFFACVDLLGRIDDHKVSLKTLATLAIKSKNLRVQLAAMKCIERIEGEKFDNNLEKIHDWLVRNREILFTKDELRALEDKSK